MESKFIENRILFIESKLEVDSSLELWQLYKELIESKIQANKEISITQMHFNSTIHTNAGMNLQLPPLI